MASIMVVDSPGFQNPRHQGRDRAATFEELCHNYIHERLQLLFYQRTFVSALERFREVWLGWTGASGAHPGFSFMLSGPALIKTQSAGLAARASAPPPSPSVSHGLLHFSYGSELGAPQALLPQLSLVWADQFLLTHTPKLKCSPAVRCSLCVEGPSCPSHLWVKTVWFAQSLGHSMGASTKGGHAAALQEALQAGQDAQAHSCMPAFTSLKKLD